MAAEMALENWEGCSEEVWERSSLGGKHGDGGGNGGIGGGGRQAMVAAKVAAVPRVE